MAKLEKPIEKQISVRLPDNVDLAGSQELIDAHLVNLPRRSFSLHIQFAKAAATRDPAAEG
jgi:hypothetical protein